VFDGERLLEVRDMPLLGSRVDGFGLTNLLCHRDPDLVVLEAVGAFHGSSAKSAFAFGRAVGSVEAVLESCELGYATLSSSVWKRKLGLSKDKAESRAMAARLWPEHRADFLLVKHDGRAEAALIVEAWRRLRAPQEATA
jgi:hypothetical protein